MKQILLWAALALGTVSCGNNNSKETTTDTDTTHHNTTTPGQMDTTGTMGKDMMTLMNNMTDNLKTMQSSGNPDNDFAALMKAHHLGAIEMAQLEVAKGTDTEIKQMAQKMIDDQQKEVAELNSFLSGHQAHGGGDAFFKEAMSIMNKMTMNMDHKGSIDRQFVSMMIPHHQGAIDMSKAYLKAGAHEQKIKTMANNIISSQQTEIDKLNAWLAKNK
jgi:uncharacterized protein (DUF305 family)